MFSRFVKENKVQDNKLRFNRMFKDEVTRTWVAMKFN